MYTIPVSKGFKNDTVIKKGRMRLMNRVLSIVSITVVFLLFAGCMGTFETARVVPLKIGATYFATVDSDVDDDSFGMPGIIVEAGWPAGLKRFGVGFHLRAAAVIETYVNEVTEGDGDGFMIVWGAKVQLPQNSLVDIALGLDVWGFYPGEIKILMSRRFGILEPYACLGVVGFLDTTDDDGNETIDIFGDDGLMSYTLGTMAEFGSGSGWKLAVEIEGGDVWVSPGVGVGLIKEF